MQPANVYSATPLVPKADPIYRMKMDMSIGPSAAFVSAFARDRDAALYPIVTGLPKEQVDTYLTAGVTGPLVTAAEAKNREKEEAVYREVISVSSLGDRLPADVFAELESIVQDNIYLKTFISPAVMSMFKQSDNPVARRAADRRITNVFMAADLIKAKQDEVGKGFWNGAADVVDMLATDLPVVSMMSFKQRQELAKRFVQVLDSDEDPAIVKAELDKILTEAADQGFFTQANRFYLNDFLVLATEGTVGIEAARQGVFAGLDILAGIPAAADIASLTRRIMSRGTEAVVKEISPVSKKTFTTEKGSSYTVLEDGTTIRNKAQRNDPGHEGDFGLKPRSLKTVYVDVNAGLLSAAGITNLGPKGARVIIKDGKASLLTWNEKANKWGRSPSSSDIPVFLDPAVGRYPLELWVKADDVPGYPDAYKNMHAGNKITSVTTTTETLSSPSSALPKGTEAHVATDTARLAALTTNDETVVKEIMDAARVKDDPINASTNVANKAPSEITPTAARAEDLTPPESTAGKLYEMEQKALDLARDIRVSSGQAIDDESFQVFAGRLVKETKDSAEKAGNLRLIDTKVDIADVLENVIQTDVYGTKKGKAFTSKKPENARKAAQKVADEIGGATVELVPGTIDQFVVHKIRNVPLGEYSQKLTFTEVLADTGAYRSVSPDELGGGFIAEYGSPLAQTSDTANALLKRAESSRSKASAIFNKSWNKVVKAAGKKGYAAVDRVMRELRDGQLASVRKKTTENDFENYFYLFNKRLPTQAERRLWMEAEARNRVDWVLSADEVLKRQVNRGVEILEFNNTDHAVQKLTSAPAGTMVWDLDLRKFVKSESLAPEKIVYRLSEPEDFNGSLGDMVATNVPKTRALKHEDVYGYNPGGSRVYPKNQTNRVVKQRNIVTLADGREVEGVPKAIMFARTEKEGAKAVSELNTVLAAIHKKIPTKGKSKKAYATLVRGLEDDLELEDIIASVSSWNPSVHTVKGFLDYFDEMGLDLRYLVDDVGDGEPLVRDPNSLIGDLTFGDVKSSPGVIKFADIRRDKALKGYGDKELDLTPPLDAIQKTFSASVAKSTDVAYSTFAINGVLRSAMEKGILQNADEIRNLSLKRKIERAVFLTSKADYQKLELERQKILKRLSRENVFDAMVAKRKDALARHFYDKGYERTADAIDWLSDNPISAIKGLAFEVMLRLGQLDQLWVQGSQALIIGVTHGITGMKAVALAPLVRLLALSGRDNVIDYVSKYAAPVFNLTQSQLRDIVKSFMQSGRGMVGASMAEFGEDSGGKIIFGKLREKLGVFYNEGEVFSRITAHTLSSLEQFKKNPAANLYDQKVRNVVAHEADKLTFAMTSTSRGTLEQLPAFQFLTYSFRLVEQLLSGGVLGGKQILGTKQKIALGSTLIALYGLHTVPSASQWLDYFNFKYGKEWDQETVEFFRNGLLDAVIEFTTGIETEVGKRLAWGEGVFQLMQSLSENNIYETLGGPSGSLITNFSNSLSRLAFNTEVGGTDFLVKDMVEVARLLGSVNDIYNAYNAWKTGEYFTKSGKRLVSDLTWGEAMMLAFGVPLEKINAPWSNIENLMYDKKYYKSEGDKISGLFRKLAEVDIMSEEARRIRVAISLAYAMHEPLEFAEIERYIDYGAIDLATQVWWDTVKANRNPK